MLWLLLSNEADSRFCCKRVESNNTLYKCESNTKVGMEVLTLESRWMLDIDSILSTGKKVSVLRSRKSQNVFLTISQEIWKILRSLKKSWPFTVDRLDMLVDIWLDINIDSWDKYQHFQNFLPRIVLDLVLDWFLIFCRLR